MNQIIARCLQQMTQCLLRLMGIVLWIGLFGACAAISPPPPQGTPLLWHRAEWSGEVPRSVETVRMTPVTVDVALLASPENARFSLLLPDGGSLTVVKVRQELVGEHGFVWHGKVEKDPDSFVTFAAVNDTVMGTVIGSNGTFYRLRHDKGSVHFVEEVDRAKLPHPKDAPKKADPARLTPEATPMPMRGHRHIRRVANTPNTCTTDIPGPDGLWPIDVMVAYTQRALTNAGSLNNLHTTVTTAIGEANQSYLDSGINQKLILLDPLTAVKATYVESSNMSQNLDDLRDGTIKDSQNVGLPTLRTARGADVVVLIVGCILPPDPNLPPDVDCAAGMSDQNSLIPNVNPPISPSDDKAYSVVVRNHATGPSYTFTHELGHVMGANHDSGDTDAGNHGLFDTGYNHGYVKPDTSLQNKNAYALLNPGKSWTPWSTIMATFIKCQSCTRVPLWSTPDPAKAYHGDLRGSAEEDNVRMLNEMLTQTTSPNIANFRCHISHSPHPIVPVPPTNLNVR